jgi:hypothetical protein
MNQTHFKFLIRWIWFNDRTTRDKIRKQDCFAPIQDTFAAFVENCKKCYSLEQNVTISEKLETFRGRCGFKQYIPLKPNKHGIKIYTSVDSKILCMSNLEKYAEKQPYGPNQVSNKAADVIKSLVEPINGTGCNITVNKFWDINLDFEFRKKKPSAVGTIKRSKPQLPVEYVAVKNQPQKPSLFGFRKEMTIVSSVPKKHKNVILICLLPYILYNGK